MHLCALKQLDDVDEFFFAELDMDGFNDLHAFKNHQGIFGTLKEKQEQQIGKVPSTSRKTEEHTSIFGSTGTSFQQLVLRS